MTRDGSTLLQAPAILKDGDLSISKIDYLDTGRIVVTGDALPRLRVSLALDGKYMGFARAFPPGTAPETTIEALRELLHMDGEKA